MPLKDWNLQATWDAAYSIGAEGDTGHPSTRAEVKLGYHRAAMLPYCRMRAAGITQALGWTPPGPSIILVGAGFGWTAEALEALGYTRVLSLDVSTYVQGTKAGTEATEVDARIVGVGLDPAAGEGAALRARFLDGGARARASRGVLNEDGNSGQSRGRIRQALGLAGNQKADWGVSESVLESLTDAEAQQASSIAHQYCTQVAHYVVTLREGNHPGYNWKTLEAWKTLIPADAFIEAGTFRVL